MSASDDDRNEEGKRLRMIYIPQSFAWTGLKKHRNEGPTTQQLAMEGLVLWNVLGFALNTDTNDYVAFSVVNKEWNQVVQTLEPPFMFRIKALLQRRAVTAADTTTDNELTADDLSHLSKAFHGLESRDSSLYRKDKKAEGDTSGNGIIEKWPFLQPHFAFLLIQFTYQAATQQRAARSFGLSREIYELTSEFLERIAERTIQKVVKSLGKLQQEKVTTPFTVLEVLVEHWLAWSGIVHTVTGITEYLDRYYVPERGLKTMKGQAQHKLVQAILEEQVKLVEPMNMYLEHIYNNGMKTATAGMDQQLLVQAFVASEQLRTFPTVEELDAVLGTSQIQESYTRIQIWMKDHILPKPQDSSAPDQDDTSKERMITLAFPNGTKLDANKHFMESSSTFSNLHLRNGDFARWETDNDIPAFKNVLAFYTIDAQTPMREIEQPVRSLILADLVGQQFGDLVGSMNLDSLSEVMHLANFLGTTRLLDLTCASVAIRLRQDHTHAEIREAFLA